MSKMHLFGTATIGSKGQIVIPVEARNDLELAVGDKVMVIGSKKSRSLTIVKPEVIEKYMTETQANIKSMTDLASQ